MFRGGGSLGAEDGAFQVPGFRNGEYFGVVHALTETGGEHDAAATVAGGLLEHAKEPGPPDVERTGGGDQDPAGVEDAHGAQVDLAITAERLGHGGTRLGEGRG